MFLFLETPKERKNIRKEKKKKLKRTCEIGLVKLDERSSAVTCWTIFWRKSLQLIHVETFAVSDSDVFRPVATVGEIVKTNLTADHALVHCGMFTVEPAGFLSTTEIHWHARFWHGATSPCREAVPLGGQTPVTFAPDIASITWCCAVRLVEEGVGAALCDWKVIIC